MHEHKIDVEEKLEIEINLSRAGKYWAQNCWKKIGKKKCLNGINIKRVSILLTEHGEAYV